MYHPQTGYTKAEIIENMNRVGAESADFFESLTPEQFYHKPEQGWTGAQNIKHLHKVLFMTTLVLKSPGFFLFMFGKPSAPSRNLSEVGGDYLKELGAAVDAKMFDPGKVNRPAVDDAGQKQLVEKWRRTVANYVKTIGNMSDSKLDGYNFKFSENLGVMTLREFALIAPLHALHHYRIVEARMLSLVK